MKSTNLVSVDHGEPTTTTAVIAEIFDRPHRNVVRSIEKLIKTGSIDALKIERISYLDSMNREQSAYRLREREALIAMPFIGGRQSERGQVRLVDSFLAARSEINRLRSLHATPNWQQARIEGKAARHGETDVIKLFVAYAKSQGSRSAGQYYLAITKATNRALFFVEQAVSESFRDRLTASQLASVAMAERIVERALLEAMAGKMFYRDAYRLAADRLRQFAGFVGQSVPGRDIRLLEAA